MQHGHQTVIIGGLALITISLIGFYLASQGTQEAEITQAILVSATPTVSIAKESPTPTAEPSLAVLQSPSSVPDPTIAPKSSQVSPSVSVLVSTTTISATSTPSPAIQTPIPSIAVVINEVAWMGTDAQASDEWIELYNPGDSSVDLSGWVLKSSTDDSPHILLEGSIAPSGYFLIERTDDTAVNDVSAQMKVSFGQGGLNNNGELLILVDANGIQKDQAGSSEGWHAGTGSPKATMERVRATLPGSDVSSWSTNNGSQVSAHDSKGGVIRGTPGSRNSATQ
jgi:hypothetical protein